MTLVSKAPAAKAALLAALTASSGLAGVTVQGFPRTDATPASEIVYLDVIEFEQSWRGNDSRNDDFTINIICLVTKLDTPDNVEARAWQLVAAVQTVVHADPSLSGVLNIAAEVSGGTVETGPSAPDGVWQSVARLRVHGQAVLTT